MLPPLTSLRAFEAAARHMSFAKAAEELSITPAALSHRIKTLEEHLGRPVFRRLNRAVELTEAGRTLRPGVAQGFDALTRAWAAVTREEKVLIVTAGPAITAKWLAPRLYGFAKAHPDIELRFVASLRRMDFERDGVDVAIRFGFGGDEGLHSEGLLMSEWMTPMATPALAEALSRPGDLAGATLIHDDSVSFLDRPPNWRAWLAAAGADLDASAGPRFSQADHALDAALEGVGVVMGRGSIAARDLMAGRLVAPFKLGLTTPAHFRILCQPEALERPELRRFIDWAKAEAAATVDLRDRFDLVPA